MFKGHPKGLYVLFFSNMGERFGYYTMMAIFALFFEAKFGMSIQNVGFVWSAFLFSIYFIPLFGGMLADKIGYSKIITTGIVFMFIGYGMMAIPGQAQPFIYISLFVIALGTGLFKGNLVVILGNLYEEQGYKKMHSAAFNIFYMGINIGAFFAPYAATSLRNWLLARDGLFYNAKLPGMIHQFLNNPDTYEHIGTLKELAIQQLGDKFTNLIDFCTLYRDSLSQGYNAAFAIASISIIGSLFIFRGFKKYYKKADYIHSQKRENNENTIELTPKQVKDRVFALLMVFLVVIFFWMAFHQNGYTLTWFAKNYTAGAVTAITKIFFDIWAFLSLIAVIIGIVFIIGKNFKGKMKTAGAALSFLGAVILFIRYNTFIETNPIAPELFQSFNPIFVVFLTPVILVFFSWLNKKGKEPSPPKKMGIGMMILGMAWILMTIVAFSQQSPASLEIVGGVSDSLVSPYWLISMYFWMTVAELFISPMGLAFVAKVSPPKLRGTMQGGWLAATAVGNMLSGLVGIPYSHLELWQTFGLLVLTSFIAGGLMFFMLKKLEKAASS